MSFVLALATLTVCGFLAWGLGKLKPPQPSDLEEARREAE